MLKKLACAALVLLGCAWPFAMHGLAMHHLFMRLGHDPRLWVAYSFFVSILPCPVLIYSGLIVFLRDQMPFPANAAVAGMASAVVFLVISIAFYLVVGQVGFRAGAP